MQSLGEHLEDYWLGVLYHNGSQPMRYNRPIRNCFKPILMYYKPPFSTPPASIEDHLTAEGADKKYHEWGQSLPPVERLVEAFSSPGDLIWEPCSGGGTTAIACLRKKRRCIAMEIKEDAYWTTLFRLREETKALYEDEPGEDAPGAADVS